MCSFWFRYPVDARPGDGIQIAFTKIKNIKIYAAVGADVFSAEGPLVTFEGSKHEIRTTYPKELFITMASNDFENRSSFDMNFKTLTKADLDKIERSGDGGIFTLTGEGTLSTSSWIFIGSIVGSIILIALSAVLIWYVCRQRKKQEVFVKVIEKQDHLKHK